ncbi:MAG: putative binding protein [Rickettsiaceae bacterium]|jgi:ATP-binding protein involved in chromosome partitioning|nr:putative binding protein [Rickettsiaceae bacterium]
MNKELILESLASLTFKNGIKLIDKISAIVIRNNNIGFSIEAEEENITEALQLREEAIKILSRQADHKITVVLTNAKKPGEPISEALPKKTFLPLNEKQRIEGIKKIICVSSGKGGVGKSTISALLAQNMRDKGIKVGVADADIYGPSIPKIFGLEGREVKIDHGKFIPLEINNLKIMSMGFLVGESNSLVWRGPMVTKAIFQLLKSSNWGELDILIIDMPPGTGDIHLSLLEKFSIDGVIIVTTPQELAVADAVRAIDMYKKFNIPLLGVIENMSYLIQEDGKKLFVFGEGGGEKLAASNNIPLLTQIPLNAALAQSCDKGTWLTDKVDLKDVIDKLSLIRVMENSY